MQEGTYIFSKLLYNTVRKVHLGIISGILRLTKIYCTLDYIYVESAKFYVLNFKKNVIFAHFVYICDTV